VSKRAILALATAAAAALVAVAVISLGGGKEDAAGKLGWAGKPLVFTPERLPADRTLSAEVSNDTLRDLRVRAKSMVVVDAHGKKLQTVARFAKAYSHGLYPPTQRPRGYESGNQARLEGVYVDLKPGERAPLTVSWRMRGEVASPLRLDYGAGSLPIAVPEAGL
jgi:hypothetical protein